jgi:glycosyltransferase involved in cell wall biosynthesis
MNRGERPLRILCVVDLPWNARLGAIRVWMELADHWRAAGHTVNHYSLSEAFPKPTSRNVILSLRQMRFASRAARFIRRNASRYDVIDSHLGTVPFSKKRLDFRGLLVARSVGFFWLYEKFDRTSRRRWPDISRGKLTGRIFYNFTRRRVMRSAVRAIHHADLLNLPNEDELKSLRDDLHSRKLAIVQPYGLTVERRRQLSDSSLPSESRLSTPKICFLGMWSVRKGARDLGEIVRLIRARVPKTMFRFLGTFTDAAKVLHDLGIDRCDWCEIIREYDPADLPTLLSDCTAGVFPSYVEGFGLGLLEQLAAAIPTVAYDAPGPRQILAPAADELLVRAGDVAATSARVVNILQSPFSKYVALQKRCSEIAARYSWPEIAADTTKAYRAGLDAERGPIIFTQPFGWRSPGGGARIMRALLREAPMPFEFICTSTSRPPAHTEIREVHLGLRPHLGRLERSRFAGIAHAIAPLFARRFAHHLEKGCRYARAIHAVAHGGLDFSHAFDVAEKLALPFFLHVHDDFLYSTRVRNRAGDAAISRAWSGAAARFVISDQLGEEYQRRYGARDYVVITDGIKCIAPAPRARSSAKLRVYFMGLFHLEYEPNLHAFAQALRELQRANFAATVTMRCGGLRPSVLHEADFIRVLPFADEAEIERDLEEADLLYLPLPFDAAHASLVRFSLSTKLVTYLGSGIPILYHGPEQSAVGDLLAQHNASFVSHSLDPAQITAVLRHFIDNQAAGDAVATRALVLARAKFSLPQIREKFWSTIRSFIQ